MRRARQCGTRRTNSCLIARSPIGDTGIATERAQPGRQVFRSPLVRHRSSVRLLLAPRSESGGYIHLALEGRNDAGFGRHHAAYRICRCA